MQLTISIIKAIHSFINIELSIELLQENCSEDVISLYVIMRITVFCFWWDVVIIWVFALVPAAACLLVLWNHWIHGTRVGQRWQLRTWLCKNFSISTLDNIFFEFLLPLLDIEHPRCKTLGYLTNCCKDCYRYCHIHMLHCLRKPSLNWKNQNVKNWLRRPLALNRVKIVLCIIFTENLCNLALKRSHVKLLAI